MFLALAFGAMLSVAGAWLQARQSCYRIEYLAEPYGVRFRRYYGGPFECMFYEMSMTSPLPARPFPRGYAEEASYGLRFRSLRSHRLPLGLIPRGFLANAAILGSPFIGVRALFLLKRRSPSRACNVCGYSLAELTSRRCPECGTGFASRRTPETISREPCAVPP